MNSMSSSGASTPRSGGTPTPPPPAASSTGDGPSPLTVGTRFVKQYYKVLSTTPDQIFRFYQPSTSFLSHGVGSQPTHPAVFEKTDAAVSQLKDRFYMAKEGVNRTTTMSENGGENVLVDTSCPIRFEFEHGAIDAQVSVNGGVLLVVTGHVVYMNSLDDDEEDEDDDDVASLRRKAFVHTFFLGSLTAGAKRSYYVHNDVLRFLHDREDRTVVTSNKSSSPEVDRASRSSRKDDVAATIESTPSASSSTPPVAVVVEEQEEEAVEEDDQQQQTASTVGSAVVSPVVATVVPEEPSVDAAALAAIQSSAAMDTSLAAPGGGVEESKEATLLEDDSQGRAAVQAAENALAGPSLEPIAAPTTVVEHQQTQPAAASPSKPKPAGSWASLVARSGDAASTGTTPTPVGTPVRPSKASSISAGSTPAAGGGGTATAGGKQAGATDQQQHHPPQQQQQHQQQHQQQTRGRKRDPDCTLVIKNIAEGTTEAEILAMFEPTTPAGCRVIGTTVSAHKAIAFVDYDSTAPVLAAVEQHQKEPYKLKDRVLEVYQKTVEARGRGGGGSRGGGRNASFRGGDRGGGGSSNAANGSNRDSYRGGGGGQRQQYRRSSRSDRGGGGGRGSRSGGGGGGGGGGGR